MTKRDFLRLLHNRLIDLSTDPKINGRDAAISAAREVVSNARLANDICALLISLCGATDQQLTRLMADLIEGIPMAKGSYEYRVIGNLGFGCKLRFDSFRGFSISCDLEDETPNRHRVIDVVKCVIRDGQVECEGEFWWSNHPCPISAPFVDNVTSGEITPQLAC